MFEGSPVIVDAPSSLPTPGVNNGSALGWTFGGQEGKGPPVGCFSADLAGCIFLADYQLPCVFNEPVQAGAQGAIPIRPGAVGAAGDLAAADLAAAGLWGAVGAAILTIPGDSIRTNSRDNSQYVIRGGVANAANLMAGVQPMRLPYSGWGLSVNTAPGMNPEQLAIAANRPNTSYSLSTIGALQDAGITVTPTPFPGNPTHATIFTGRTLDPATAARISNAFLKGFPNPTSCVRK